MKISNSKKQLAEIIHVNGGWVDAAEWAAQNRSGQVCPYSSKPVFEGGSPQWGMDGCIGLGSFIAKTLPNWHQTILSRDEYSHLYPAPDADGWIEWKGGECPVVEGTPIDIRHRDGEEFTATSALGPYNVRWGHDGVAWDVVAYRLHTETEYKGGTKQPDSANSESAQAVETKPAIEQLAADYRNAKDYADRKQQEADAAKADAEAKLAELVAAGKSLGLVLSVAEPESELVITDWRDLRVGDRIWVGGSNRVSNCPEGVYDIGLIDDTDGDQPLGVIWMGDVQWPRINKRGWRFISRPAKGGANA